MPYTVIFDATNHSGHVGISINGRKRREFRIEQRVVTSRMFPWARWASGALRFTLIGAAVATSAGAQTGGAHAPRLDVIWSSPIIAVEPTSANLLGRSQGFFLTALAAAPGGRLVALGEVLGGERPGPVLLPDAMNMQPRAAVALRLTSPSPFRQSPLGRLPPSWRGSDRPPILRSLAVAADGAVWVSGIANGYIDLFSYPRCDGYLARLDPGGVVTHERSYDPGPCTTITGALPRAGGDVIVVGEQDQNLSWLGRVAPNGRIVAEERFGGGKGVAAAALHDGRVLVVGITSEGRGATYRDSVSAWFYDEVRGLGSPIRLREGINQRSGSYFARVAAVPAGDGAYVASSWDHFIYPAAVEIARVEPPGAVRWRTTVAATVQPRSGRSDSDTCNFGLATLPSGDALVACAFGNAANLFRLDGETGNVRVYRVALPECGQGHPTTLFLVSRDNGTLVLAGSRPTSNIGPGCSWLGRLTMPRE